nr:MAG TPA: hypothetical protein [Caudoviricetes sp.]
MVHYAALFFVNTDNPSRPFVLNMTKYTTSKTDNYGTLCSFIFC